MISQISYLHYVLFLGFCKVYVNWVDGICMKSQE